MEINDALDLVPAPASKKPGEPVFAGVAENAFALSPKQDGERCLIFR